MAERARVVVGVSGGDFTQFTHLGAFVPIRA